MNKFKLFSGWCQDLFNVKILAENESVALDLVLEDYPDTVKEDWEISEIVMDKRKILE